MTQLFDLMGAIGAGQQARSNNMRNKLAEIQLADTQARMDARSKLVGGYEPSSGITWETGRQGEAPGKEMEYLAGAYPDDMAKATIKSLYPDPKDSYLPDGNGGLWNLKAPGGPARVGGDQPNYTTWDGKPLSNATTPPAASPPPLSTAPAPTPAPTASANLQAAAPPGAIDMPLVKASRRQFETGGAANPSTASNPNSTALGPDQFTKSTWMEVVTAPEMKPLLDAKIGPNPDLNDPRVQEAIQSLRQDEDVSGAAAEVYAKRNADELRGANIEPSPRNLLTAHFLGGSGAKRFLSAPPNDLAPNHVSPEAARANRRIFFNERGQARTVGEVLQMADGVVEQARAKQGGQATPQATPQVAQAAPSPQGQAASGDGSHLIPIRDRKGVLSNDFGLNPQTGQLERYPSRAAQTNVNIDQRTADKALTDDRVKRLDGLRTRAATAEQLLPKLDLLEQQLGALSVSGPGASTVYQVAGTAATVARSLGVPPEMVDAFTKQLLNVNSDDQAAAATVEKLTNDFVSQSLRASFAGLGGASNMDVGMIQRTVPGINNPTQANQYLIRNILRPTLERDRELFRHVRPLQRSADDLARLDDEEEVFNRSWNERHKPPEQQPGGASPPATQNATPTAPAYAPEQVQAITQQYPNARLAPDGFYYVPNPDNPPGGPNPYLRVKI